MVVSVQLCDEGLLSSERSFSDAHIFPTYFGKTASTLFGPCMLTEGTIESTVGAILNSSTRAVKHHVLRPSACIVILFHYVEVITQLGAHMKRRVPPGGLLIKVYHHHLVISLQVIWCR